MKTRARTGRAARRGMALIAALFAAFVAATMISVLMTVSRASANMADLRRDELQAHYLAQGAVEEAKKVVQTAIANWEEVPEEGTSTIDGLDVAYTIAPTGMAAVVEDDAGIQTILTGYEIEARAVVRGRTQIVHRIINAEATPIFQFAVFYTNDLEILPGPDMTLGGRVHCNGDIYLGCGGTLTVDTNYLRSVGKMYRSRKDTDASEGTVQIRRWVENPFDASEPEEYVKMYSRSQMDSEGVTTDSGYDSAFTEGVDANGDGDFYDEDEWMPWGPGALENWSQPDMYADGEGSTVLSGTHGVTEAVVPNIGSISMFEEEDGGDHEWNEAMGRYTEVAAGTGTHSKGFFHENADLSVITYEDGSWDAFDSSGLSVKADLGAAVQQEQMLDTRQSSSKLPVCEIDLAQLASSGHFPANGLLYAAHYGMGTGADARGVRLVNGSELKAGLTVVSEGSIYVQGDYNTVDKKPAAVIADAVSLLSNAWDDSKTSGALPTATATTFNMAIVTGNYETEGSTYNGGLENLPRFHEHWGGVSCEINGALVNTWES